MKTRSTRRLFDSIAVSYDRMNKILSFGRDQSWRRRLIARTTLVPEAALLDLATGTGDLARAALAAQPELRVVAADFSLPMMIAGRQGRGAEQIFWCGADANALPFSDQSFDTVISAFLIRNVDDIHTVILEQKRLLRSGGQVLFLDTSPPRGFFAPLIRLYLRLILPLTGQLIARDRSAYSYLQQSTENFHSPTELDSFLRTAGFIGISHETMMFGSICIHSATRV